MSKIVTDNAIEKLRPLNSDARYNLIYQWVRTKHIRIDEFKFLLNWSITHPYELSLYDEYGDEDY